MIRASNHFEIGKRGAEIDNADFIFWKCQSCGAYALFDRERELLYMDPNNLSAGVLALDGVDCTRCSPSDGFQEATGEDLAAINAGAWGFAM